MLNKRRSEFEIISEILTVSMDGAKSTEILYKGYLNYVQLKQYVLHLTEKEILKETITKNGNGYTKEYYTTSKGKELLASINRTLSLLK